MAKVNREQMIEWDGVKYRFTPSNRLLRRIDAGLAPQTHMSVLAQLQDAASKSRMDPDAAARVPFTALAYILAEMIAEAGGDADEDGVYQEIMSDLTAGGAGIPALIESVIQTVTPPERVVKNSQAPQGGKKKKAPKA